MRSAEKLRDTVFLQARDVMPGQKVIVYEKKHMPYGAIIAGTKTTKQTRNPIIVLVGGGAIGGGTLVKPEPDIPAYRCILE